MKTQEEFQADAERLYEQARDENKPLAVLTLARGLLEAYAAGADHVFAQRELALTKPVSDREM